MEKSRTRIQYRIMDFLKTVKTGKPLSPVLYLYIAGTLFFFSAAVLSIQLDFSVLLIFLIILGYFLSKLINNINQNIRPPAEVLLFLLLGLYLTDTLWINIFGPEKTSLLTADNLPGLFPSIIQNMLLSLQLIIFSILIVQNSDGKKRSLIGYLLIGYLGFHIFTGSSEILSFIFHFFMFLLLYRKTKWTEELTKLECWIYLASLIIIFMNLPKTTFFPEIDNQNTKHYLWFYIPGIFIKFFYIYFLAVIIKIPFILVYHHASLSRKIRIANRFQSSFPLIIQFIILILMFYYFIAGWQAENVRASLETYLKGIESGRISWDVNHLQVSYINPNTSIEIPGYQSIFLKATSPQLGVLELKPLGLNNSGRSTHEHFIYLLDTSKTDQRMHLVKIDTTLLDHISRGISLLAASHLNAYSFKLTGWDSVFYKFTFWMGDNRFSHLRIFPFSLTPHKSVNEQSFEINAIKTSPEGDNSKTVIKIFGQEAFVVGRIFIPVYTAGFVKYGYWAFDIVYNLDYKFITSSLSKQLLFWLIVYLVVNLFVIRRVIKFGNQINNMIIQKFNQLKIGIRQISDGNLGHKIKLEGEDDFVELAHRFNQMGDKLKETIAEVREKDRLESELRIAREVQLSLLPKEIPEIAGYSVSAITQTAREVGGDFYDILPLDKNRFLFVIGDVSGKGTSAAFYMAQCISLIRYSRLYTDNLSDLIGRLNQYFSEPAIDRHIFVTAIIGILDTRKNQLQLIRAGHTHPLLISTKKIVKIREIETSGIGIGLERRGELFRNVLKQKSIKMHEGETIFLYTDGLVEATRQIGALKNQQTEVEFFGEDRLKKLLASLSGNSTDNIQKSISTELEKFYAGEPKVDDYTLLILQRVKNGSKL